jgi:hypothetical protein
MHEDQYTFLLHLAHFLEWETFQTKFVEKITTHFLHSINFPENRAIYEIMWKNIVEPDRPQMAIHKFNVPWSVRASSYIPISRPTDATCDRFLSSIYMCITLHVSSVKRSSSGVSHCTYSLQVLCLCLSAVLSCKKLSYKTVPQTDTNTETGGCMYGEGLLMMSAWRSKHTELSYWNIWRCTDQ